MIFHKAAHIRMPHTAIPCGNVYCIIYLCRKTKPLHLAVAERRNLHTTVYAGDALQVSVRMMYNVCDIPQQEMPQAAYK